MFFDDAFQGLTGKQPDKPIVIARKNARHATPEGGTVIGLKFEGGVIIAADDVVVHGQYTRYDDIKRVFSINQTIVMGAGGDFADVQYIRRQIEARKTQDLWNDDKLSPSKLHAWMARLMYNARNSEQPFNVHMVVGGMEKSVPYLACIDSRGMAVEDDYVAIGTAAPLVLPLMKPKTTETPLKAEEVAKMLRKCMEVAAYRDCDSSRKYYVTICTETVSVVRGPFAVEEHWEVAALAQGY